MKTDANSAKFAIEATAEALTPLPSPPQPLDDDAMHYWPQVLAGKRLSYWTSNDLIVACQIARDYAAIETLSKELEERGQTYEVGGRIYANPAAALLDNANKRIGQNLRLVQAHSVATNGRIEGQRTKNAVAREVAAKVTAADSPLIARPH